MSEQSALTPALSRVAGEGAAIAAAGEVDCARALDPSYWQAAFDAHGELFADVDDGARIGMLVQPDGGAPAGRRRAGLDAVAVRFAGAPLLVFTAVEGGVEVTVERFESFAAAKLDLLLIADDEACAELAAGSASAALRTMKRLVRRGSVMFFVLRTKAELQDAGYEDFLDSLGIPFLGSCR